eukprot:scaffold124696_cov60-Phaeocystis_antarctica.AAC.2
MRMDVKDIDGAKTGQRPPPQSPHRKGAAAASILVACAPSRESARTNGAGERRQRRRRENDLARANDPPMFRINTPKLARHAQKNAWRLRHDQPGAHGAICGVHG